MRKINILSKNVYNRIAAGEVIDRPYSAVKELVENSIDAGATEIEVHIECGGKHLIKVIDNGSGIYKDDLRSAFMPHATSKISTAEDLEKIQTLGFRGEALASISVVSKVQLTSRAAGAKEAYTIICDDGNIGQVQPAALDRGTVIEVFDLFYTTPVRQKFLKADKKEEQDITTFISKYILSHPEISFKYYIDGKLNMQSFGGGIDEAMIQVYGAKAVSSCIKIDGNVNNIRVHGFIGNQNFFKPNKTYQNVFINGRYIVNSTVAAAMSQAYSSYAMKRQYPFYVLFVDVPPDIVDVNVHPNKADVRFVDSREVFSAIYKVVSSVLDGVSGAADFVDSSVRIPEIKSTASSNLSIEKNEPVQESLDIPFVKYNEQTQDDEAKAKEQEEIEKERIKMRKYGVFGADAVNRTDFEQFLKYGNDPVMGPLFPDTGEIRQTDRRLALTDDGAKPCTYTGELDEMLAAGLNPYQEEVKDESYTYKGNMFNTYLIFEHGDDVIWIDQHAAHERLIYDSYIEQLKRRGNVPRQCVHPFTLTCNSVETQFIERNLVFFRRCGFGIEWYGAQSFTIDEIPADLGKINIEEFFYNILSDKELRNLNELKLEDMYKDKLAMSACKAAVKGGSRLNNEEIEKLLKMIDGDFGLKCPHGRPVCVKLTKKQVERMFKRIV